MNSGNHHSGDVCNVGHQNGAHGISNFFETLEVDDAAISAGARHDHLGMMLFCYPLNLLKIDPFCFTVYAVTDDLEIDARKIERMAMRKMPSLGQLHAHQCIPRLHNSHVSG